MSSSKTISTTSAGALLLITLALVQCRAPAGPTPPAPAITDPATPIRSACGKPLPPPRFSDEQRAEFQADLAQAQERLRTTPNSVDAQIWVGRRLGYLWRYREAIAAFTRAIELDPDDPRPYRHRGHRYVSIRELDLAIADLEYAKGLAAPHPDKVEPDGQPNAAGIPTSTLKSNIGYHLGLAWFLKGDFAEAERCYRDCLEFADYSDDMWVATGDWLVMTLRRQGRFDEAREFLTTMSDREILENEAYRDRLKMYAGELAPAELLGAGDDDVAIATYGYGVAEFLLTEGETDRALDLMKKVTMGRYWPAFGFIAAEAELCRRQSL